jgi:hypothetical protein
LGVKGIKSGSQATFFVAFDKEADGSYPNSFKMNTLRIGSALYPNTLPEYTYQLDTKYTITIKGSEADNLTLEAVEDKGENKLYIIDGDTLVIAEGYPYSNKLSHYL